MVYHFNEKIADDSSVVLSYLTPEGRRVRYQIKDNKKVRIASRSGEEIKSK